MNDKWRTSKYRLIGVSPIIFHNGQLANPLNDFSKEIKKVTSKRKKTDADYERFAELEFKGGLYVNDDGHPIMPSDGIEAILVSGAKLSKDGKSAKSGVYCPKPALLEYDGPKTPDELWKNEKFRMVNLVKNPGTGNRVVRTRPIFNNWSCEIELRYNIDTINEEQIFNWLNVSGSQCGAYDWRPKYGRFTVEKVNSEPMLAVG